MKNCAGKILAVFIVFNSFLSDGFCKDGQSSIYKDFSSRASRRADRRANEAVNKGLAKSFKAYSLPDPKHLTSGDQLTDSQKENMGRFALDHDVAQKKQAVLMQLKHKESSREVFDNRSGKKMTREQLSEDLRKESNLEDQEAASRYKAMGIHKESVNQAASPEEGAGGAH